MNKIDKFTKAILDSQKDKSTKPYDTTAKVVRVVGDTAYVHIAGGVTETPATLAINAKEGDDVRVHVTGGKAYVMGNPTSPPTDDSLAKKAQDNALKAARAADSAVKDASIAKASANQAVEDADIARTSATQAVEDAKRAHDAADSAQADAIRAEESADRAQESAEHAQADAENASEYAARALGNLSTVQNVAETLNWITAHGTMTLTTDRALDPTHVYFVQDNDGDYVVGNVHYSVVSVPNIADISTYYELSIDESLNNYVATHLAVDSEGLWILPDAGGNKVLIATGQGATYPSAGTYIIGKVNNVDTVLATFGADGAQIGQTDGTYVWIDERSFRQINADETTEYVYFSDLRDDSGYYTHTQVEKRVYTETPQQIPMYAQTIQYQLTPAENIRVQMNGDWYTADSLTFNRSVGGSSGAYTLTITFSKPIPTGASIQVLYDLNGVEQTYNTTGDGTNKYVLTTTSRVYPKQVIVDDVIVPGLYIASNATYLYSTFVAEGDNVTVEYKTQNRRSKAYTLGFRKSTGIVGPMSFASGYNVTASGNNSQAFGSGTTASGENSHAEGYNTNATGQHSHAEGVSSTASGRHSHAEGSGSATGDGSHAEGGMTTASGGGSHAEGSFTTSSGSYSHSGGQFSEAAGRISFAHGDHVIASQEAQTVIGKFNTEDTMQATYGKYAFIIGNGTSDSARSNSFAVTWKGDIEFQVDANDALYTALSNMGWL